LNIIERFFIFFFKPPSGDNGGSLTGYPLFLPFLYMIHNTSCSKSDNGNSGFELVKVIVLILFFYARNRFFFGGASGYFMGLSVLELSSAVFNPRTIRLC